MFVVDHHFPMTTNILVDTPISWPGHCKSQEMISYNWFPHSSSPIQNWLPSSVLGSKHGSLTNWSPPVASDVPPQSAAFSSSLSVEIHQKCPSGVPINALPLQKNSTRKNTWKRPQLIPIFSWTPSSPSTGWERGSQITSSHPPDSTTSAVTSNNRLIISRLDPTLKPMEKALKKNVATCHCHSLQSCGECHSFLQIESSATSKVQYGGLGVQNASKETVVKGNMFREMMSKTQEKWCTTWYTVTWGLPGLTTWVQVRAGPHISQAVLRTLTAWKIHGLPEMSTPCVW